VGTDCNSVPSRGERGQTLSAPGGGTSGALLCVASAKSVAAHCGLSVYAIAFFKIIKNTPRVPGVIVLI
jgi:hypothetical protein